VPDNAEKVKGKNYLHYDGEHYYHEVHYREKVNEENLDEAPRVAIVKLRIRGGKVQRRRKVATQPGMTLRGGRLIRMSPAEIRKRKLGARKGKQKRKAKAAQSMRKRKISLQRRKRLGV
jgi:hypothetical protein